RSASFARRYAELLGNTRITTGPGYQGDNRILSEAVATLARCRQAVLETDSQSGVCYHYRNNPQALRQFMPRYDLLWLPLGTTDLAIEVDIWRTDASQPWQPFTPASSRCGGQRLRARLHYQQLRVAVVTPMPFNRQNATGWFDAATVQAIRTGSAGALNYSALLPDLYRQRTLSRARLFVLAGRIQLAQHRSSTAALCTCNHPLAALATGSAKAKTRAAVSASPAVIVPPGVQALKKSAADDDLSLSDHVKIPCARPQTGAAARAICSSSDTVWDSGDLYQTLGAGKILAVIPEDLGWRGGAGER
ncbi:MAG: hypothetical protein OIF34_08660, partial [Porticoccaceae bacterium]|nr:hypothetical protein [Porticoccaceae bacterium]